MQPSVSFLSGHYECQQSPPKYKNGWFLLFDGILWSDKILWYNGPRGVMSHGCTLRIYVKKRKQRNLTETKERKQESDKRWCNVMGSPPGQISHCYTLRILRDISWSSKIFGTTNTFVEQTNMGLFGMFIKHCMYLRDISLFSSGKSESILRLVKIFLF